MSWRSRLFPNSHEAKIEKILRESAQAAQTTYESMRPLHDLELSILTAADTCANRAKPYLRPNPELDMGQPEQPIVYSYVFYEFLFWECPLCC